MERTLCVWCPDWPLRRPDAPHQEPGQVVGVDNRVLAVNEQAARAGVKVGMRRREAESICPSLVTLSGDTGAEAARFEPVAAAVEGLIPRIEILAPGTLLAPVAGAVSYYGGERPLAEQVMEEVHAVAGPGFRFGIAAEPGHEAVGE